MSDTETVIIREPGTAIVLRGHGGLPGPEGPPGPAGDTGPAGPPGGPWLVQAGSPNGTVLATADTMYLDNTNGDVWQSNGGTSWTLKGNISGTPGPAGAAGAQGPQGTQGPAGSNGTRGSLWTSGAGVPSGANNAGDMYLRTATNIGDVYQGNGGTSWTLIGNIRGPAGANGANGADGNPNIFYNAVVSPVNFGNSETTLTSVTGLTAGTYMVEAFIKWNAADSVQAQFAVNYSGSFNSTNSRFDALRVAGSTAHMENLPFNTLTGTSAINPQLMIVSGILVATTSGTLSISAQRNSSGTSTAPRGVYIRASR